MNRFLYTVFIISFTTCLYSQPAFSVKNLSVEQGKPVCCDVVVTGFKDILTAQFTFAWNPSVVQFDSVGNFTLQGLSSNNFGTSKAGQGILSFSWFDVNANGKSLKDGDILFSVCFTATGNPGDTSPLEFAESPIKTEVTDINSNGEDIGATTNNGSVSIIEKAAALEFQKISIEAGSSACNYLSANGIDALKKLSGTVEWDTAVVSFDSVCCLHPMLSKQYINELFAESGRILLNYTGNEILDLKTSDSIAGFCYTAKSVPGTATDLSMTGNYFPLDIKNSKNKPVNINSGQISIDLKNLRIDIPDIAAFQGETIRIPLFANVSGILKSWSGNLVFDDSEFQYSGVYTSKIPGFSLDAPQSVGGFTTLSWNWQSTGNDFIFSPKDSLFYVELQVNGSKGKSCIIALQDGKYPSNATININKVYQLPVTADTGAIFVLPDNAELISQDDSGKPGDIICVPVRVENFKNIPAFEMIFRTDPAVVQAIEIKNKLSPVIPAPIYGVQGDLLKVTWQSLSAKEAITLSDGDEIFDICYQLTGKDGEQSPVILDTLSYYLLKETGTRKFQFKHTPSHLKITSGNAALSANADIIHNNCPDEKSGIISLNVKGGQAPFSFIWSNGMKSQVVSGLADGNYSVTLSDASVPSQLLTYNFTIHHLHENPVFTAIDNQQIACPGGSVQLNADNSALFYVWSGNSFVKNGVSSVEISTAGTYIIAGTDPSTTCTTTDTFQVFDALPLEDAFVSDSYLNACDEVVLEASQSPGVAGKWSGAGANIISPDKAKTSVNNLAPGLQFFVWTVSTAACPDYSSDTVWVFKRFPVAAGNDLIKQGTIGYNILSNDAVNPGQVLMKLNTALPAGLNIDSFGNLTIGQDFTAADVTISYTICDPVCTDYCSEAFVYFEKQMPDDTDTTTTGKDTTHISKAILPNAISPNGDGSNDFLVFDEISAGNHQQPHLIIFNRAGHMVYEDKHYANNWDGKDNSGTDLQVDTYYFVLYLDLLKGKILKGPVTILR